MPDEFQWIVEYRKNYVSIQVCKEIQDEPTAKAIAALPETLKRVKELEAELNKVKFELHLETQARKIDVGLLKESQAENERLKTSLQKIDNAAEVIRLTNVDYRDQCEYKKAAEIRGIIQALIYQ